MKRVWLLVVSFQPTRVILMCDIAVQNCGQLSRFVSRSNQSLCSMALLRIVFLLRFSVLSGYDYDLLILTVLLLVFVSLPTWTLCCGISLSRSAFDSRVSQHPLTLSLLISSHTDTTVLSELEAAGVIPALAAAAAEVPGALSQQLDEVGASSWDEGGSPTTRKPTVTLRESVVEQSDL